MNSSLCLDLETPTTELISILLWIFLPFRFRIAFVVTTTVRSWALLRLLNLVILQLSIKDSSWFRALVKVRSPARLKWSCGSIFIYNMMMKTRDEWRLLWRWCGWMGWKFGWVCRVKEGFWSFVLRLDCIGEVLEFNWVTGGFILFLLRECFIVMRFIYYYSI